jgi:hypothetical protein
MIDCSEVAARLIEVGSVRHSGLVVLNVSFVAPDPNPVISRDGIWKSGEGPSRSNLQDLSMVCPEHADTSAGSR